METKTRPDNKTIVLNFFSAMDNHEFSTLGSWWNSNHALISPLNPFPLNNPSHTEQIKEFYSAFPDARHTITDIFCEGNIVCCYGTLTGTHRGEYYGTPPTGRKVSVLWTEIFYV